MLAAKMAGHHGQDPQVLQHGRGRARVYVAEAGHGGSGQRVEGGGQRVEGKGGMVKSGPGHY